MKPCVRILWLNHVTREEKRLDFSERVTSSCKTNNRLQLLNTSTSFHGHVSEVKGTPKTSQQEDQTSRHTPLIFHHILVAFILPGIVLFLYHSLSYPEYRPQETRNDFPS